MAFDAHAQLAGADYLYNLVQGGNSLGPQGGGAAVKKSSFLQADHNSLFGGRNRNRVATDLRGKRGLQLFLHPIEVGAFGRIGDLFARRIYDPSHAFDVLDVFGHLHHRKGHGFGRSQRRLRFDESKIPIC